MWRIRQRATSSQSVAADLEQQVFQHQATASKRQPSHCFPQPQSEAASSAVQDRYWRRLELWNRLDQQQRSHQDMTVFIVNSLSW